MENLSVLSREEVALCLKNLRDPRKNRRATTHTRLINLLVFRLSCCCGLRVKELTLLKMKHVQTGAQPPVLHIPKDITKGQVGKRKGRFVPLSWDKGTLEDLEAWKQIREFDYQAGPEDSFLCNLLGEPLSINAAQKRWRRLIAYSLGPARASYCGIHEGRHTYCTHSLYSGRSLNAVARAAGHSRITTTSRYLHYVADLESKELPDVFRAEGA